MLNLDTVEFRCTPSPFFEKVNSQEAAYFVVQYDDKADDNACIGND